MHGQRETTRERFRGANERLKARLERLEWDERIPFICECPDGSCIVVVEVTRRQYEAVRARPDAYLVAPGHEPPGDDVVEFGDGYVVVAADAP